MTISALPLPLPRLAYLAPSVFVLSAASTLAQQPANYQWKTDWLIQDQSFKANVSEVRNQLILANGLFKRVIDRRLGTTTTFTNLMTSESIIRAIEPEG